jgi:hypothetical protein
MIRNPPLHKKCDRSAKERGQARLPNLELIRIEGHSPRKGVQRENNRASTRVSRSGRRACPRSFRDENSQRYVAVFLWWIRVAFVLEQ